MKLKKYFLSVSLLAAMALPLASYAESIGTLQRDLQPGATPPIWVSMSGFSGEAAEVLQFDLYVQGFNFTNADNAQYVIVGSNNGNLQGRVTDRFNKST